MTTTFTKTFRKAVLALTIATSLAALTSTETFAYSAEAQQQCTGDAMRLCSSEIPNISKITACMYKHKAELSPGCRSVMDKDLAASKTRKVSENTEN